MKNNLEILEESGVLNLKWPIEEDWTNLMKEAQLVMLNEVVKRKYNSGLALLVGDIEEELSTDEIVNQLLKEIES